MSRRDYSIPDCPKIGRYDGLGMAAVPLAIADKERELGINNSSSYSYEDDFEEYEKDMNNEYKRGWNDGYKKGIIDGKIEIYKKIMESYNLSLLQDEADDFLIFNDKPYHYKKS